MIVEGGREVRAEMKKMHFERIKRTRCRETLHSWCVLLLRNRHCFAERGKVFENRKIWVMRDIG